MNLRALALAACLVFAAWPAAAKLPCAKSDKPCLMKAMQASPVRTLDYWSRALATPLVERIGPAPPELVAHLEIDNVYYGYTQRPRAATLSPEFLADVKGAFADVLPVVRKLVGGTLAGIYFVEDLGSTGFSDLFVDAPGDKPAGAYVVLDAKVLGGFKANAWATWKENTPFKPGNGWKVEAKIEESAEDTRRSAIRYILLHELAHVVAATRPIHPRWDKPPKDHPADLALPFFDLSWKVDRHKDLYVSLFDGSFVQRSLVVYYLGAKLDAKEMTPVYKSLERTNFPTLYAATSPGDDFAESFASYIHTQVLKRPWSIRITKDGQPDFTYRSCWDDGRCLDKFEFLQKLLQ